MYIVTPQEMREIDSNAINKIGIDGSVLMENASRSIYLEVKKKNGINKIVTFAGKGNNGGDVLVASRMLYNDGYDIEILLLADYEEYKKEAKKALNVLINLGVKIEIYSEEKDIEADLILDGIFGTGFMGEIKEPYKSAIEKINKSSSYVISADIPSGINGESGTGALYYVKADKTVTFGAYKTGFFQNEGVHAKGELVLDKISIPDKSYKDNNIKGYILDYKKAKSLLPERKPNSNKGTYGKIYIVAGSTQMAGAGILSAMGALRTGAGLVNMLTSNSNVMTYQISNPGAITEGLEENEKGYLNDASLDYIKEKAKSASAVAIGPGLGKSETVGNIIKSLSDLQGLKLIVDADGLNSIADNIEFLKDSKADILLTPHPGEMARLLNCSTNDIQANRIYYAKKIAKEYNVCVLLKGMYTVLCNTKGDMYINTSGNDALSKGGSGDVLTGMICGFAANMDLFDASLLSAFVHGYCAKLYVSKNSSYSMTAKEIADYIPKALKELNEYEC